MWDFLNGFFMARATGSRSIRILLFLSLAGALVAGIIYVGVVLNAVSERSNTPHVSTHSSQ